MSGFSHDAGVLEGIAGQLRDGATSLDEAIGGMPDAVDAGFSSEVVATALRELALNATGLATTLEQYSDRINTTSGAYGDVENTNEGAMRVEERKSLAERVNGPL